MKKNTINKPIIAIDIDDVLAHSVPMILEYSNTHWNTELTIDDYDENFSKMWQVSHKEADSRINEYFKSGILSDYMHHEDAFAVFEKLKKDFKFIVVTSRSTWLKDVTVDWINKCFPYVFNDEDIYFAGFWDGGSSDVVINQDKGDFLSKLGAKYIIDDQPKHCLGADKNGIKALLFGEYSWNKTNNLPQSITRVKNWNEVLRYFEENCICNDNK